MTVSLAVKPEHGESGAGPAELTCPSASLPAVPWGGKGGQLISLAVPALPHPFLSSPGSWLLLLSQHPSCQGTRGQGLAVNPSSGRHRGQIWDPTLLSLLEPCGTVTFPCPCIPLLKSHTQGLIFRQAGHRSAPKTSGFALFGTDWSHLRGPQCQPPAQPLLWEGSEQQGGTAGVWEALRLLSGEGENGLLVLGSLMACVPSPVCTFITFVPLTQSLAL